VFHALRWQEAGKVAHSVAFHHKPRVKLRIENGEFAVLFLTFTVNLTKRILNFDKPDSRPVNEVSFLARHDEKVRNWLSISVDDFEAVRYVLVQNDLSQWLVCNLRSFGHLRGFLDNLSLFENDFLSFAALNYQLEKVKMKKREIKMMAFFE
jgi:hypothetical protein